MVKNDGNGMPVAFVGGAHEYPTRGAYAAYAEYRKTGQAAAYFQFDQSGVLADWIDANHGNVIIIAHSWGAEMAASVIAAGHDVCKLVTVDPVSWSRPDFQLVAEHARTWVDYNATGGQGFAWSNVIAGLGGAWSAARKPYVTSYAEIPVSHGQAICFVAPAGC